MGVRLTGTECINDSELLKLKLNGHNLALFKKTCFLPFQGQGFGVGGSGDL